MTTKKIKYAQYVVFNMMSSTQQVLNILAATLFYRTNHDSTDFKALVVKYILCSEKKNPKLKSVSLY